MLGQEIRVDPLEPIPVLQLVLPPAIPVGDQVWLLVRKDQLDVKTPPAVVREVDKIGVLLGSADNLDCVRMLEDFVVTDSLEEEPEVQTLELPSGRRSAWARGSRTGIYDPQTHGFSTGFDQNHPGAALIERLEQRLEFGFSLLVELLHSHFTDTMSSTFWPSGNFMTLCLWNTSSSRRFSRSLPTTISEDVG